jgi:hypothetical protein
MSLLQTHDSIISAFHTYWTETEVAWPNLLFDPSSLSPAEWARITNIPADSNQVSMGGATNLHRQFGLVLVELYIDQDSGARRSLELADLAINFFHGLSLPGITFRSPDTEHIGVIDGWLQKNISCDYYTDDNF